MPVKQEPASEGEQEFELPPDLPLECMLCAKPFHSVSGLKVRNIYLFTKVCLVIEQI